MITFLDKIMKSLSLASEMFTKFLFIEFYANECV